MSIPLLGHKRVSEINSEEVERFVRDVAIGKTARDEKVAPRKRIIVRGGEGAARKVIPTSRRCLASLFVGGSPRTTLWLELPSERPTTVASVI